MADQNSVSPVPPENNTPALVDASLAEDNSASQTFLRGLLPATSPARKRVYAALLRALIHERVAP